MWVDQQSDVMLEWKRGTPKVNVRLGFTKPMAYEQSFTEGTVKGTSYPDMLEVLLQSQLEQDGTLETVVFQKYGATPNFARVVLAYLEATFPQG